MRVREDNFVPVLKGEAMLELGEGKFGMKQVGGPRREVR